MRQSETVYRRKWKIALVTDSTCDLPREMIDHYQIHMVPINISFGENHYLDKITIQPEQFYSLLDESPDFPKTAQVNEQTFVNLYSQLATHYDSIIAVHLTSRFSGTYFNSVIERFDRLADAGADDGALAAARPQLGEEVAQPGHGLRDLEQAPDELRPRRLDQPDLPVEHLRVAHAVVVRLLLELPPAVADERLQRDLVALVRRHRAVVVEEGEEARAGGGLGAACLSRVAGHGESVHGRDARRRRRGFAGRRASAAGVCKRRWRHPRRHR